jgi:hypothetical protein
MMNEVSVTDAGEVRDARQLADREAPVHQAVMHDDVREAEDRHADAGAEGDVAEDAGRAEAAVEDERDSDGSVQEGEGVVALEEPAAAPVVRAMNSPESVVPHAAVKERGPALHRCGRRERDDDPDRDRCHGEGAPFISEFLSEGRAAA